MHIDEQNPTGSISSIAGPALAAGCIFAVTIEGKGGHAAEPHLSVDPLLAASVTILALQQLISREKDPLHNQVLTITYFRGGTTMNVISQSVEFGGTMRSLTTNGLNQLRRRLKEVIEAQAYVHRCKAFIDMKEDERPVYPAVVNDETLHQHVQKVGRLLLGSENVKICEKIMASEDFAFYQEMIPGIMFNIGIRNEEVGSVHPLHSSYFFLDEDVLPLGAAVHTAVAELYLSELQELVY
ncbi:IAA-amino acid hydrolase ILR1-like 5 [Ranunculus cassubicifolius]